MVLQLTFEIIQLTKTGTEKLALYKRIFSLSALCENFKVYGLLDKDHRIDKSPVSDLGVLSLVVCSFELKP